MKRRIALALLIVLIGACGSPSLPPGRSGPAPKQASMPRAGNSTVPAVTIHASSGPVTFAVELADTPAEHERGLMNRTSLPEGHGMLFVFDPPRPVAFWMKDTLIPLDIIFVGDGGVIGVASAPLCAADPCPTYPSIGAVSHVLEINAGQAARSGIRQGDLVEAP